MKKGNGKEKMVEKCPHCGAEIEGGKEMKYKSYLLENIEESVWDKFSMRARDLRLNIKEAMHLLVIQFGNGDIEPRRGE